MADSGWQILDGRFWTADSGWQILEYTLWNADFLGRHLMHRRNVLVGRPLEVVQCAIHNLPSMLKSAICHQSEISNLKSAIQQSEISNLKSAI
jgi:hypothetical protein